MSLHQDLLSDLLFSLPSSSDLVAITGLSAARCGEIFELRDPTFRHSSVFVDALEDVMRAAKDSDLLKFGLVNEEWVAEARAVVKN